MFIVAPLFSVHSGDNENLRTPADEFISDARVTDADADFCPKGNSRGAALLRARRRRRIGWGTDLPWEKTTIPFGIDDECGVSPEGNAGGRAFDRSCLPPMMRYFSWRRHQSVMASVGGESRVYSLITSRATPGYFKTRRTVQGAQHFRFCRRFQLNADEERFIPRNRPFSCETTPAA